MKKRYKILILLIVFPVFIWLENHFSKPAEQRYFESRIRSFIHSGETKIPLSELTNFEWDVGCITNKGDEYELNQPPYFVILAEEKLEWRDLSIGADRLVEGVPSLIPHHQKIFTFSDQKTGAVYSFPVILGLSPRKNRVWKSCFSENAMLQFLPGETL